LLRGKIKTSTMTITAAGALEAQKGSREKRAIGENLLHNGRIQDYAQGVCYDAVAFTRYMLGANIHHDDLSQISGQEWRSRFQFTEKGIQWNGAQIERGTAVGFQYIHNGEIFHAGISLGGSMVRGDNGGKLGAGWTAAGDSDLTSALELVDSEQYPKSEHVYRLKNETTLLKVWLSRL